MKLIIFVLIILVVVLFLIPEDMIGDYQGLLKLKYFLRDTAIKIKSIILDLAKSGKSDELEKLQEKAENKIKEEASKAIPDTVNVNIGGE